MERSNFVKPEDFSANAREVLDILSPSNNFSCVAQIFMIKPHFTIKPGLRLMKILC